MGASFRNVGQIKALCGCDLLTIAPNLLDELSKDSAAVPKALDEVAAKAEGESAKAWGEKEFRWHHNEDAMATEKLSEGICLFAADSLKLEKFLTEKLRA